MNNAGWICLILIDIKIDQGEAVKKHILSWVLSVIIAVAAGIMAVTGVPTRVENMVEDAIYQNRGGDSR